jgi:hypothetical protein
MKEMHITDSWSRVLLEKAADAEVLKNIRIFSGTRRFITDSQEPSTGPYSPFSDALILCSSFNTRDQVSQPYKTAGKNYSFVCFHFYAFRQRRRRIQTEW